MKNGLGFTLSQLGHARRGSKVRVAVTLTAASDQSSTQPTQQSSSPATERNTQSDTVQRRAVLHVIFVYDLITLLTEKASALSKSFPAAPGAPRFEPKPEPLVSPTALNLASGRAFWSRTEASDFSAWPRMNFFASGICFAFASELVQSPLGLLPANT